MKKSMIKYLQICLSIIIVSGCYNNIPEKTELIGKPLPSFTIKLPDTATYLNTKNIQAGKPIVLFYYSPYCAYCRAQINEIITHIDKLKEIQFYLITNYSIQEMKSFYDEYRLNQYTNIIVGKDTGRFIPHYFKPRGVPYLAIYGKNKVLKESFVGKVNSSQIKKVAFN